MVDLTRGMRPQLNLSALVIFTMQLPLSAHSYSHYYNHILYEIQIQIQYVSMRVVCVCARVLVSILCTSYNKFLLSTAVWDFDVVVRRRHFAFRIRIHVFQSDFSPYYYFNMRYTSKQTYVHTQHTHTYRQTYIRTYICRYMCKYMWVATYVHMRCSLGAQSLGCSGMWRSQQLFC